MKEFEIGEIVIITKDIHSSLRKTGGSFMNLPVDSIYIPKGTKLKIEAIILKDDMLNFLYSSEKGLYKYYACDENNLRFSIIPKDVSTGHVMSLKDMREDKLNEILL